MGRREVNMKPEVRLFSSSIQNGVGRRASLFKEKRVPGFPYMPKYPREGSNVFRICRPSFGAFQLEVQIEEDSILGPTLRGK